MKSDNNNNNNNPPRLNWSLVLFLYRLKIQWRYIIWYRSVLNNVKAVQTDDGTQCYCWAHWFSMVLLELTWIISASRFFLLRSVFSCCQLSSISLESVNADLRQQHNEGSYYITQESHCSSSVTAQRQNHCRFSSCLQPVRVEPEAAAQLQLLWRFSVLQVLSSYKLLSEGRWTASSLLKAVGESQVLAHQGAWVGVASCY